VKHPFAISRATAVFLVLGTVGLLVAWLAVSHATEPEYDGQPLSSHLASLTYGDVRRERAAREAVRAIGTNALPHLIQILDARESRFKSVFNQVASRQSLVRIRCEPLFVRQMHAALACQELGPAAVPAIPALERLINDPELAPWAVQALAEIGPQTFPLLTNALFAGIPPARATAAGSLRLMRPREAAVPPLLAALKSSDGALRALAAESLGALGLETPAIVTALISRLDDSDGSVRIAAARSLGWLGQSASRAVPRLIELYRSEEGMPGQWHIATALVAIDPSAAESAGAK
jgi:HEAT repeat protein